MLQGRTLLIYLSIINEGNWDKIYQDICDKRSDFSEEDVEKEIAKHKCNFLTLLDEEYPDCLKNVWKPPFVLFYYGDISLLNDYMKNIAVVGSRAFTSYGQEMTEKLTKDLSKHFTIVSGLARGIDSIAHYSAIENGGKTIAILGSGIEKCYPTENLDLYKKIKKEHLLLSEYPAKSQPDAFHFPLRNRIIAALSRAVLVTEASKKSGTSITTSYAIQMGRSVCCVPQLATLNSLCNMLISEGAALTEKVEDIYDEINFRPENNE